MSVAAASSAAWATCAERTFSRTLAPADVTDMASFKRLVKMVFVSYGSKEGGATTAKPNVEALQQAGDVNASAINLLVQSWQNTSQSPGLHIWISPHFRYEKPSMSSFIRTAVTNRSDFFL